MTRRSYYEIEVSHEGLNKYRHIKGADVHVVNQKAAAQMQTWDEMWQKKLMQERKKNERERAVRNKENKKNTAAERTAEAERNIVALSTVLQQAIETNNTVNWNSLIKDSNFGEAKPKEPTYKLPSVQPTRADEKYCLKPNLLDTLIPHLKNKKLKKLNDVFVEDLSLWEKEKLAKNKFNEEAAEVFERKLRGWGREKEAHMIDAFESNEKIKKLKNDYHKLKPHAILDASDLVLSNSEYPDYFNQSWRLDYSEENQVFVVDYALPDIEDLPKLKSVSYIISRDEFVNKNLTDSALRKIYDSLLYQISLRTIHELFEADSVNAIDTIVFNGWVDSIDKATGINNSACIMSCQASKDEFLAFNLSKVDPKACFKMLKGIGSSKLHSLSPVAPIIRIEKDDSRFVDSYEVVDGLSDSDNLAAMDWQDFENLIRELFEKEFSVNGGEVKITQASRDGGVDAIAFDPDPIRGGKIVIQAKRYTNVVGVSSVRDLFGTLMNEGATKGILVTTAHFGGDAYEFAKGKPISLLDGGNLLSLLDKHGHKAVIDIKAAKKILSS